MEETFSKILLDGTTVNIESNISTMQKVFELQGMFEMRQLEDKYNSSNIIELR